MLDERKLDAITRLLAGENKSDTAKAVGISRATLYEWLKDSEFLQEMKNRREELVECGREKLSSRLDKYLEVLHTLATTSTDKRTQATCAMYLTDRILGKVPNTLIEKVDSNNNVSTDILSQEFEEFDRELKIIK